MPKESWVPPPLAGEDDHESLAYIPPKAHPTYNGMGPMASSSMPATSQPLQARPPGLGSSVTVTGPGGNRFPIEALARREGVKLQEVYVPKNIVIPTKNQAPIALKAGQRVMLIKTPKGIYLRLRDQIVKIRVPNGLLPFGPIPNSERGCSPGSSRGSPSAAQNKTVAPPDVVTLHSSGEDD